MFGHVGRILPEGQCAPYRAEGANHHVRERRMGEVGLKLEKDVGFVW